MLNDVIVVENRVDLQCVRHVHLMSNAQFDEVCMRRYGIMNGAIATQEGGVWHLRAVHPYRGALDVKAACVEGKVRRLVVWNLEGYVSVKQALFDARTDYRRLFGGEAQFAFARRLPNNIENGHDVGGMTVMSAEWMLERSVAVGCKG